MWRVLSVFENFRSFLLKVLLRSTGLWDSIRYSCKLSFFHSSLVHSYCHPLQFFFRNSNNLSVRLETPRYYRRKRRWSFVYKPTISIFCRIGKGHFSHFSSNFLLSLVLFLPGSNSPASSESAPHLPPSLVGTSNHTWRFIFLMISRGLCDLKLKFSPQISDGKIWGNKVNRPTR